MPRVQALVADMKAEPWVKMPERNVASRKHLTPWTVQEVPAESPTDGLPGQDLPQSTPGNGSEANSSAGPSAMETCHARV